MSRMSRPRFVATDLDGTIIPWDGVISDRTVRALVAMQRWGFTPAAGFAANAARYPNDDAIIDELGHLTFA